MHRGWKPPMRWVFGAAAALSLFSTLQAYRLTTLSLESRGMPIQIGKLLILNLVLWFVPALLSPVIVALARRFPLDAGRRLTSLALHTVFAFAFAAVHTGAMIAVRRLLSPAADKWSMAWWSYSQFEFLTNLDWALMTYAVIVGLSHAVAYYYESQERKVKEAHLEMRLIEARLKTLEAELNPHFLFNTLHAISTLVHRDPEAADRMISRLSDLLRITFDRAGEGRVTLKEEIEFLQKYLEIEQTRFQDRLTIQIEVDPETLDADVPRMILQPLAENAIKHGVSQRTGAGTVRVSTGRDGNRLWMVVADDGVGLSGGTLTKLRTGVGLANTRARLECLYGAEYQLDFSGTSGGLAVRVEIPFQRPSLPATATRVA